MRALLAKAHRHRQDGELQAAEALCRQLLDAEPRNAEALDLLGQIKLQSGQAGEAAGLFRRAIESGPGDPQRHFSLALALLRQGGFAEAEQACRDALTLAPDHADALFARGLCCEAQSRPADAEAAYRQAVAARPDFPEALNNLGAILARSGRPAEAVQALDAALAGRPDFMAARFNRGTAHYALRRLADAEADFARILEVQPSHAGALNELGRVMLKQTRVREAVEVFRRGHEGHPEDPRFLANLASALELLNDLPGAEEAVGRALALAPEAPALLYTRASLEHRQGRFAEARQHLDELLSMELSPEHRSETLFELGHVLDELGETSEAFRAFSEGNTLRARLPAAQGADAGRFLERVRRAGDWFTGERIRALAALAAETPVRAGPGPVFFVGFPRSGTTLLERALKAHPGIVTSDERSPLVALVAELTEGGAYPDDLARLTVGQTAELRERFWARAEETLGPLEGRLLVDKMPLNIVNLGLANGLFPEARALVALRDPRDTCLSCFMQRFQFNDAMANFFDLEGTVRAYVAVMELWRRYRQALSLPVLEYRYEELVEDFEGTLRRVLDFLGLDWHPDMAAYRERAKSQVITTPSYRRVTDEVDSRAAARWRRYRQELSPVLPALRPWAADFGYPED